VSLDARVAANLLGMWGDGKDVLHVGLGGSWRKPNSSTDSLTISAKPAGVGTNLVSTGAMPDADRSTLIKPELAGAFGPFWAQGEYFRDWVDLRTAPDPTFDGWYAEAGWIMTGEHRPYKGKLGNFERIKPDHPFSLKNGGWGAWELLGRYDNI